VKRALIWTSRVSAAASLLCAGIMLAGCGGSTTSPSLSLAGPTKVAPGGTAVFTALPQNTVVSTPKYFVVPQNDAAGKPIDVGAFDANTAGLYHAPVAVPANNFQVMVFATYGNLTSNSLPVNVEQSVNVTPAAATVSIRRTAQFSAIVTGDSKNAVTWNVKTAAGQAGGSMDPAIPGLYHAPNTIAMDKLQDTIEAHSAMDNTLVGTAVVTVVIADPISIGVK